MFDFLKKALIGIVSAAVLVSVGFFIGLQLGSSGKDPSLQAKPTEAPAAPTAAEETEATEAPTGTEAPAETEPSLYGTYTLSFIGNLTLGSDGFMATASSAFSAIVGNDYSYPLKNVASVLQNDDLTLGNLECVLKTGDFSTKGGARLYKGEPEYAQILSLGGVDLVSLANNHIMDYGEEGLNQTESALDAENISYVCQDQTAVISTSRGLKVGIYAIGSQAATDDIDAAVQALKDEGAQLLIAMPHWGGEDTYVVNPDQKKLGRKLIDAGFHIVAGTHPHHVQKVEEYHDGLIYYSLGSFCSGTSDFPSDMDTLIMQQTVTLNEDGTVTLGERTPMPACMSSSTPQNIYQPTLYPEDSKAYSRVGQKLYDDYTFGKNAQEYPF